MLVATVLIGAAAGAIAARTLLKPAEQLAKGESLWRVQYEIGFEANSPNARIRIALPESTDRCKLVHESFSHSGLMMDVLRGKKARGRNVVAIPTGGSTYPRFDATFDIRLTSGGGALLPAKSVMAVEERARYLRSEENIQIDCPEVSQAVAALSEGKASQRTFAERIFEYCSERLKHEESAPAASDAASVLRNGGGNSLGCARAMVALCRAGRVPARLVTGFALERQREGQPRVWVEAHLAKRWVPYDPRYGYSRQLPPNYVPVRRDDVQIAKGTGVSEIRSRFSVRRLRAASEAAGLRRRSAWGILDLRRLPLGMQQTLAVLLLLPMGALVTALFRNIIGVHTFGTFTPALLALSFLYSDWRTGLALFAFILATGLLGRALLNRLRLLMVPRLSLILTVVVLCTTLGVSVLDCYGLTPTARAVILPLVILVMMIERFFIRTEEEGLGCSLRLLAGTLVVSIFCFMLLRWKQLGLFAIRYPEALLFVAAALLAVGRYSGYRLTELLRFKDLTAVKGT